MIYRLNKSVLKKVYKKRRRWARKGDYGHLLVVGGSKVYTGAPFIAALAALRAGCDLVTVAAPERAADLAAKNVNIITYPLKGNFISKRHIGELLRMTKKVDAVAVGNGLGRARETMLAINKFIRQANLPCVIDADAIHAVKGELCKEAVFTPHEYEFYALTGKKVSREIKERTRAVKEAAKKISATILLKGRIAVISDGSRIATNEHISIYATKGGTGDALAGICGSLLSQGAEPFYAACAASYISGMAGMLAGGKQSMLATDIIDSIPDVR